MNQGIEKAKREGGVCLRCGADEYRIDGYCTIECRDLHEAELERFAERVAGELETRAWKADQRHTPNPNPRTRFEARGNALREAASLIRNSAKGEDCTCGSTAPDEFGNRDQIENPDCPVHGSGPVQKSPRGDGGQDSRTSTAHDSER